jgi:hypothetical protein
MATNAVTQSSSKRHGGIELEAAERNAARRVGGVPGRAGRELPSDLIDEAVDRARLRAAVELPDGGRLSDEVGSV